MNFDSYHLGATLYMPIIHAKVPKFVLGEAPPPATSIILCLEDALAERNVGAGLDRLRWVMEHMTPDHNARLFVRPRTFEMASEIVRMDDLRSIAGLVAPKVTPANAERWLELSAKSGVPIMPTLESAEFFDPANVIAIRDIFDRFDPACITTVRIGGNDLLGALALRRQRGVTSWEGPLAWVLSMMSSILISAGYSMAAPVFDIFDDAATLQREVERDVAAGFSSKTIIHPAQARIVEDAMRVSQRDYDQALRVLAEDSDAVFQMSGAMCEPMTHCAWARRVLARAEICGMLDEAPVTPHVVAR